jgi:small-conductance mechanosensitive channel
VPAGVLLIVNSYVVIKRTQLESQKFELEIREKEQELAGAHEEGGTSRINQLVAQPIPEGRRVQEILLRAIVLFLVLQVWSLFQIIFGAVTNGIGFGLSSITTRSPSSDIIMAIIVSVLARLPAVGYWLVFFALGGPLLTDMLK